MTVPALHVNRSSALDSSVDVLALGVLQTKDGPRLAEGGPHIPGLAESLAVIGISGARDEVRRLVGHGAASSIALVGLGASEVTPDILRYAAGTAARQLVGIETLTFALPLRSEADVLAVLEGAGMGAYSFTQYLSASAPANKTPATTITVVTDVEASDDLIDKATIVIRAVHLVKDLVNTPPSDLYPETFAQSVVAQAEGLPVDVTVMADAELRAGGFGGLVGVGAGSPRGPRMVKMSYSPTEATKHIALVGKGITFDTGGLSLKPAASMVGMKYDMTGAASVMAVVLAAAQMQLKVRITGWLCLAENMPSGTATRPNDVLRIRGGKTVEVLNTDAEGRLVLADGLVAASEEYPDAIIDVATLTGAATVALGNRYSAAMGDEALVDRLLAVAKKAGETMWAMPLPEELRASLASDVADIANAKIGSTAAGMLLAGVFLGEFIGSADADGSRKIPWAHLDIAGTANNGAGGYGFTGKGPSGVAIRTLLALAEEFSAA
ncbi:MAG: aminopeptidase [Homoserinimonas sp.]|nr:aminopeptidase [Homoserinimonas sp.]